MMHIVISVLYAAAYLFCYGELVSGNGSIFRLVKLKFGISASLSCTRISCSTELDAMVRSHMESGCVAAWFDRDGDSNATSSYCVCLNNGISVNEMACTDLHMIEFGKFIPGK